MDPTKSSATTSRPPPDVLEDLLREIRGALGQAKSEIEREIRSYPTPIPRCDAQFNHLHALRGELARELDLLAAGDAEAPEESDRIGKIERFLASAPWSDQPAERDLRARVKAHLSALRRAARP